MEKNKKGYESKNIISKSGSGTDAMVLKKYASIFFLISSIWFIFTAFYVIKASNYALQQGNGLTIVNLIMAVIFVLSGLASLLHDFTEIVQDYVKSYKRRFLIKLIIYFIVIFILIGFLLGIIHMENFMQLSRLK